MSAPLNAIGWTEPTLMTAFDMVDEVLSRCHPESDAYPLLRRALDAIENADCELEREGGAA